jgi:dTDP-4-amino-4,6-dideoxygalactose transaminase
MKLNFIPFNKPYLPEHGSKYVLEALKSSRHSGDGPFTERCHAVLEEVTGCQKALLTTSCTHALEMAAILLNIIPGDEVILPSFTFVSTANAFVLRGAVPVFVDIRADTLNINENLIERAITPKTKAIVVVHYGGIGCEMNKVCEISKRYNIPLIEDNAHGLFGKYHGRPLGSFGNFATLSFHETKNISCGEGGALLINDPLMVERAEILREKGTNRSQFYRGNINKYSWVDIGSSWLPSDILAALLYSQLEVCDETQLHRRNIWNSYHIGLHDWAEKNRIRQPVLPQGCESAWHLYYLLMPSNEKRDALIKYLQSNEINAVFHYLPLHLSTYIRNSGLKQLTFPVTENASKCLIRLPLWRGLTDEELHKILNTLQQFSL